MKTFAISGVAGYIAPRHLKAIKATGNHLCAALDPHDSVGILDNYFPRASFFTEYERFDRHLEKLKREGNGIDYLSICTPNFLHDAHIRLALRLGADAICEKPLVLNPWNLDALEELEQETDRRVYTVLQLRLHPALIALKEECAARTRTQPKKQIRLTYVASRGTWYRYSWKSREDHSGGLCTNIGIHFFDALLWLFGKVQRSGVYLYQPQRAGGFLELEHAEVQWFLSIDDHDLPEQALRSNMPTHRSIAIDGKEVEFTQGFTDLHTRVYEETLNGHGYTIPDIRPAIELCYAMRHAKVERPSEGVHPALQQHLMREVGGTESVVLSPSCLVGSRE